jgi:hypothetical protein
MEIKGKVMAEIIKDIINQCIKDRFMNYYEFMEWLDEGFLDDNYEPFYTIEEGEKIYKELMKFVDD